MSAAGSMPEAHPALVAYLNDHLGGATGACEITRNAVEKFATSPHRNFLSEFLTHVDEDRATLEEMIGLGDLLTRAQSQRDGLEQERLAAVKAALMPTVGAAH